MNYMAEYERWLASPALTADERAELEAIRSDEDAIKDRFFAPLSFGTAGLRGVLGVGLYRMNRFTVGAATQGLANLIVQNGSEACARGVAIAYDSRHFSPEFAQLAANGISVKLYDELRPTPELSFAIRYYGTIAGINITASHNPKEYNGYKVYWEDGAQLPPKEADVVAQEMGALDFFADVKTMDFEEAKAQGLVKMMDWQTDEAYLKEVLKVAINPDCVKQVADDFKLVYTPFHGAGYRLVPEILKRIGYKHIICVPEQMVIDGDFPTEMARAAAEKNGVDCFDTFTGFKFLAEKIKQFEATGSHEYLFAFEESYGYLAGDYARDKDAVTASMLIAEMAAYYRTKGMTLYDAMQTMYEKYGYYTEQTISITMPGVAGLERMKELMAELRATPLTEVAGHKVEYIRDYQSGVRTCVSCGKTEEMELSGQNVLYYELAGGTSFIIRPSGTEPKVKVYIMAKADSKAESDAKVAALADAAKEIVK